MPKFSAEITLGVNQNDVKNAQKGFMAIGSSVEQAGSLVKKLKDDTGTATTAISQRVLEAVGSYGKLEKAVEVGSKSSIGNLKRTTDAVEDLEQHIRQAQAAGSPVPEDAIQVVETLRARVAALTAEMGRQAAVSERTSRNVDDATRAAGGLGKGIHSLSDVLGLIDPRMERLALKGGLVAGAFLVVGEVVGKVGGIVKDLGSAHNIDGAEQLGNALQSIASLDFAKAGRDLGEFVAALEHIPDLGAATRAYVESGAPAAIQRIAAEQADLNDEQKAFLAEVAELRKNGQLTNETLAVYAKRAADLVPRLKASRVAVQELTGALADGERQRKNIDAAGEDAEKRRKEANAERERSISLAEAYRAAVEKTVSTINDEVVAQVAFLEAIGKEKGATAAATRELERKRRVLKEISGLKPADATRVTTSLAQLFEVEDRVGIAKAIESLDVSFEKAARTGILAALGKIKEEPIKLAITPEQMQQAKAIRDSQRPLSDFIKADMAKAKSLYQTGLLTHAEYVKEINRLEFESLNARVAGYQQMLSSIQGMIGSLRALGINVGGSAIGKAQAGLDLYQQGAAAYQAYNSSALAGSGAGTAAIMAVAVLAIANWWKQRGDAEAQATVITSSQGMDWDYRNNPKGRDTINQAKQAIQQILDYARDFITSIGGAFRKFSVEGMQDITEGPVTLGVHGRGKGTKYWVEYANGVKEQFGKDLQAAMEFATIQVIKATPTAGLDPIVAAAIHDSVAKRLDEFEKQIAAAQAVSMLGYSSEHSSFRQQLQSYAALAQTINDTITDVDALAAAHARLAEATDKAFSSEARRLKGIPDVEDYTQLLADFEDYSAQYIEQERRLREQLRVLAEQQAAAAAHAAQHPFGPGPDGLGGGAGVNRPGPGGVLPSTVDDTQNAIDAILQQLLALEQNRVTREEAIATAQRGVMGNLLSYLSDDPKYRGIIAEFNKKQLDMKFQELKLQAIALGMWDEATQKIFDAAYQAGLDKINHPNRGGGGGNRQADRQGVVDALRDYDLSKLGAAQRGLADINKKWDDHAKAAHGNAALLAQIAAARRDEIALLLKQLALGLRRDVGDFLGRGGALGGALRGIDENAQGLIDRARDLMKAGKMTKDEFLRLRDTIRDAQAQQRQSMVQNAANSLFQELYGLLGMDKEAAQLKYDMTVAELHIKLEELKIAVKKYELEGKFIPGLEDLIKRVEAAGPGIFSGGSGGAVGTFDVTDIQTAIQQRMATALEMLRRYQGQNGTGNSAFMQELARVQQDFVQIREGLGNTLEVQTAYAAAIRDVITRFLDPVRDQLREMQYGEASVLSPLEQFQSIFAEAQAAAARFAAGDLSVVETAPQLIQQLLALAGQAMPQGGAGYRSVYEWAQAFLNQMLGLQNAPLNPQGIPVPGPAPVFPVGTATFPGTTSAQILGTINNQGAVRPVTDAIVGARDMQLVELRAIRAAAERTANAVERAERFRGMAWEVA